MQEVETHTSLHFKHSSLHAYIEILHFKGNCRTLQTIYKNEARASDPFWELVCTDMLHLMGPAAQPIRMCKPETIAYKDTVIKLDCATQETALFVQQFAFLILGILKPYFPNIKEVKISKKAYKRAYGNLCLHQTNKMGMTANI